MAANINGVFNENLQNAILQSKVLIVGAGGIGCEILKNLVMTGFMDIEIVSRIYKNKYYIITYTFFSLLYWYALLLTYRHLYYCRLMIRDIITLQ